MCVYCRKLKRLNLGGNELTSVPQKALSLLENLRKLEIQENKIRDIKDGDFEGERMRTRNTNIGLFYLFYTFNCCRTAELGLANTGAQQVDEGAGQRVPPLDRPEFVGVGGQFHFVHR